MNHPRRVEIDEDDHVVRLLSLKPGKVVRNIEMSFDKAVSRQGRDVAGLKVFLVKDGERTALWGSETVGEVSESQGREVGAFADVDENWYPPITEDGFLRRNALPGLNEWLSLIVPESIRVELEKALVESTEGEGSESESDKEESESDKEETQEKDDA